MSYNQNRFMKGFTLFIIVFCLSLAVMDIVQGQYGWALIQLVLAGININAYSKS